MARNRAEFQAACSHQQVRDGQCQENEENVLWNLEDVHIREQGEEKINAKKSVGTFIQKGYEE